MSEKSEKYIRDIRRIFAEDQKRFDKLNGLFTEMRDEFAEMSADVRALTEEIRHIKSPV